MGPPLCHDSVAMPLAMSSPPSPLARGSLGLGRASLVAAVAGPLAAHFALVPPLTGFMLLAVGLLLGLLAIPLGLGALARGGGTSRARAAHGLLLGLAVVGVTAIGGRDVFGHPRINDITTDTLRPPEFVRAPTLAADAGRDMRYPGESVARQQRDGYGEIAPLGTSLPPAEAFARVQRVARATEGWTITREDASAGALEGVARSRLFRFEDDFVIEVRAEAGRTRIHMRSKSRDGRSDLGVNAVRIRTFLAKLAGELG